MRTLRRVLGLCLSFRSHVIAQLCCNALPPLELLPEEELVVVDKPTLDRHSQICEQLLGFNRTNKAYLNDIALGRIEGVFILVDQRIVHYGFLMKRNRNRCLLGLPADAALIGHAYTVRSYRGRGCQARSVLARAHLAKAAGFTAIYAETSPDNLASQRGLIKAGMRMLGRLELIVVVRCLVIRWRRPPGFQAVNWCSWSPERPCVQKTSSVA